MGCAPVFRRRQRTLPENPRSRLISRFAQGKCARRTRKQSSPPAPPDCFASLWIPSQPVFPRHAPSFRERLTTVMGKLDVADKFGAGLLLDPAGRHVGRRVAGVEALDPERAEGKIVHRRDGFAHQALIPIALREPEAAVALRIVRPRAKANIPDRLAITA